MLLTDFGRRKSVKAVKGFAEIQRIAVPDLLCNLSDAIKISAFKDGSCVRKSLGDHVLPRADVKAFLKKLSEIGAGYAAQSVELIQLEIGIIDVELQIFQRGLNNKVLFLVEVFFLFDSCKIG